MKKIFSVIAAIAMLFALCVPAFAGDAVDAMEPGSAKTFAQTIIRNAGDFADKESVAAAVKIGANSLKLTDIDTAEKREAIVQLAFDALAADGLLDNLTDDEITALAQGAVTEMETAYSNVGATNFDPSEVVDNIADGFSDNDLAGLFDTLRNTVTDLSDRLSNAFLENSGNGEGGNGDANNNNNNNNDTDNTFGGTEPTGDTAVYAVAGVAAVAAIALVLTKSKKSK